MTDKDKRKYIGQLMAVEAIPALGLWVVLIILRAFGFLRWHWAVVLSGVVWIPWSMYALTALLIVVVRLCNRVRRAVRLWKVDRRIIRQAKAAKAWDKLPLVLGGRALELKAWKAYKIKRESGETDAQLRARCTIAEIERGFKVKKRMPIKAQVKRLTEAVKRIAAEHGYNNVEVKTDGYNVDVTIIDETVPKTLEVTLRTDTQQQQEGAKTE